MSFTPADVIVEVREQMLDTEDLPFRYSDAFILRKINQILKRMLMRRPDLFTEVATIPCVIGALQRAPDDSVRIMDVLGNTAGASVKEVNQDVLEMLQPAWESLPSGPAVNWMRYSRDPNRFYVYPSARAVTDTLSILYAKCPPTYGQAQAIALQDVYLPAVIDGTCWMLESIDAEHVESGRAAAFKESYEAMLASGLSSRALTDTDAAGGPSKEEK